MHCRIFLNFIFPPYASAFALPGSHTQTAFALLLPCIKLGSKNFISHKLGNLDDVKPEVVIFRLRSSTLFSCRSGGATSIPTAAERIGADLVPSWLSLRNMKSLVRVLDTVIEKMPLSAPAFGDKET